MQRWERFLAITGPLSLIIKNSKIPSFHTRHALHFSAHLAMYPPHRQPKSVTFSQAIENSPSLARLAGMVRESSDLLKSVESLLPAPMRASVKAGPIDGETWCLLISSNAAAAKLRQLLPSLQARLQANGHNITSIRLKLLISQSPRQL